MVLLWIFARSGFVWTYIFSSLGNVLRNGIIKSYGDSVFNILRSCQTVPKWPHHLQSSILDWAVSCAENTNALYLHCMPANQTGETRDECGAESCRISSLQPLWAPGQTWWVGPGRWVETQRTPGKRGHLGTDEVVYPWTKGRILSNG